MQTQYLAFVGQSSAKYCRTSSSQCNHRLSERQTTIARNPIRVRASIIPVYIRRKTKSIIIYIRTIFCSAAYYVYIPATRINKERRIVSRSSSLLYRRKLIATAHWPHSMPRPYNVVRSCDLRRVKSSAGNLYLPPLGGLVWEKKRSCAILYTCDVFIYMHFSAAAYLYTDSL